MANTEKELRRTSRHTSHRTKVSSTSCSTYSYGRSILTLIHGFKQLDHCTTVLVVEKCFTRQTETVFSVRKHDFDRKSELELEK